MNQQNEYQFWDFFFGGGGFLVLIAPNLIHKLTCGFRYLKDKNLHYVAINQQPSLNRTALTDSFTVPAPSFLPFPSPSA